MKRYSEYKKSGFEWVGEIPTHWSTNKLKHISDIKGRIGFKGYTKEDLVKDGEGALTIGAKHIDKNNKIDLSEPEYIKWEKYLESPEIMVNTGDILVTQRGSLGKVALIENAIGNATINPSMVILKNIDLNAKYLYYFLNGEYFKRNIEIISSATAVPMISQEELGNFNILLPLDSEQSQISNFLDCKTHQIDDLLTKKQILIELLKEKRTALINHAVTKGLDPQVPMKNSGIVWLGEIPEHWLVKRLKFLVDNIIEKSNTSGFKVALENIESWTGRYLKTESPSELTGEMKSFKPNDVLFNKLRPYLAKVYLSEVEGECVGELLVLRPQAYINPKFLYYRLLSRDFIEVVNSSTYGAKMPRASWEDFIRNLIIPYPDILEQEMIVESIEKMSVTIERTIIKLEHEIELISEYKTSLINEAVTGKIKVSDGD